MKNFKKQFDSLKSQNISSKKEKEFEEVIAIKKCSRHYSIFDKKKGSFFF